MSFKSILFLNILNLQHFVQRRSIPSRGHHHVQPRSRHVVISLGGRIYGRLTAALCNPLNGALLRAFDLRCLIQFDVVETARGRYNARLSQICRIQLISMSVPWTVASMVHSQCSFNITSTFDMLDLNVALKSTTYTPQATSRLEDFNSPLDVHSTLNRTRTSTSGISGMRSALVDFELRLSLKSSRDLGSRTRFNVSTPFMSLPSTLQLLPSLRTRSPTSSESSIYNEPINSKDSPVIQLCGINLLQVQSASHHELYVIKPPSPRRTDDQFSNSRIPLQVIFKIYVARDMAGGTDSGKGKGWMGETRREGEREKVWACAGLGARAHNRPRCAGGCDGETRGAVGGVRVETGDKGEVGWRRGRGGGLDAARQTQLRARSASLVLPAADSTGRVREGGKGEGGDEGDGEMGTIAGSGDWVESACVRWAAMCAMGGDVRVYRNERAGTRGPGQGRRDDEGV
ncbi:hypothetical protein B0H16DRAFT_1478945 [Mycena metata]|uniref:Uncharacterized protein n=1 Tax=Mycena metata TaxID=1033252 RepID=A0AAD7H5W0_9AGAR|nr:hypothetical protein B0H16DRAFT_1478945 [Mycena metata]